MYYSTSALYDIAVHDIPEALRAEVAVDLDGSIWADMVVTTIQAADEFEAAARVDSILAERDLHYALSITF